MSMDMFSSLLQNLGSPPYPGVLLRAGSRGNSVLLIQQYLNKIAGKIPSLHKLAQDGIFGSGTRNAVIAFQKRFGLSPDGIVGPLTWNKIIAEAKTGTNQGSTPGTGSNSGNSTRPGTGTSSDPGASSGSGSGSGSSNGSGTNTGTSSLTSDESEVLSLINQQRSQNGLPALRVDPEVQKVARIKAHDMVDNNYFSHTSPTYGSPFQMLSHFGVSYKAAAENIASNPSNNGAVTAWMNSSGHRANILSSNFGYTGIGVVSDPKYGKTYVQMFVGK